MSVNFTNIDEFFNTDSFDKFEKIEEPEMKETQMSLIKVPDKTKPIAKRNYDSSSKWSHREEKRYLKFVLREIVEKPQVTLSWKIWKPEGVFPRMAQYIGTKNPRQCKSFDQRKKQSFFIQQNVDMLQYVEREIRKFEKNDMEVSELLEMLRIRKSQESSHMALIREEKRTKQMIETRLNELLYSMKEQIY